MMKLVRNSIRPAVPATFVLVGLVAVLVGGLLAISGRASNAPATIKASPVAEGLLAAEIAKLPAGLIKSASLSSPSQADVAAGVPDRGDNWLWIEATARDRADAVASAFQASFLASAFADAAPAASLTSITGVTVHVRSNTNELLEENAWFIPPQDAAPLPAVAADHASAKAAVSTRFRQGAQQIGARLKSVSFTDLPRLVADATVSVSNPRAFVANAPALLSKVIGADGGYDGRIIRAVDSNGRPVSVAAYNYRTRSGEVWIDPAYEASYPGSLKAGS